MNTVSSKNINVNDSSSISLFIIGWNIWFFVLFFTKFGPTLKDYYIVPIDILRFCAIGQILMILSSLRAYHRYGIHLMQSRDKAWMVMYLGWITFTVIHGSFSGRSPIHIWIGGMALLFPLYMFIGVAKENWRAILIILKIHQSAGIILGCLFMSFVHLNPIRNMQTISHADTVINFLYPTTIFLFFWFRLSFFEKSITIIGFIIKFGIGFLSLSRGTIVFNMLIIVLWLYTYFRSKGFRALKQVLIIVIPCTIFAIIMFFKLFPSQLNYYYDAGQVLSKRFGVLSEVYYGNISYDRNTPRYFEAQYFLRNRMQISDWFFGKGIAAKWDFFGIKRTIVHVGFVHLIFIGGVPLLLLVIYFLFKRGLITLLRTQDSFRLMAASMSFLWFCNLFVYGIPNTQFSYLVLGLSMGQLVAKEK